MSYQNRQFVDINGQPIIINNVQYSNNQPNLIVSSAGHVVMTSSQEHCGNTDVITRTGVPCIVSNSVSSCNAPITSNYQTTSQNRNENIDASQVLSVAIDRAQVLQGNACFLPDLQATRAQNELQVHSQEIQGNRTTNEQVFQAQPLVHSAEYTQGPIISSTDLNHTIHTNTISQSPVQNSYVYQIKGEETVSRDGMFIASNFLSSPLYQPMTSNASGQLQLVTSGNVSYQNIQQQDKHCNHSNFIKVEDTDQNQHAYHENQQVYQTNDQLELVGQGNQSVLQNTVQFPHSMGMDDNLSNKHLSYSNFPSNYTTSSGSNVYATSCLPPNNNDSSFVRHSPGFNSASNVPISRYIIQVGKPPVSIPSQPGVEVKQDGQVVIRTISSKNPLPALNELKQESSWNNLNSHSEVNESVDIVSTQFQSNIEHGGISVGVKANPFNVSDNEVKCSVTGYSESVSNRPAIATPNAVPAHTMRQPESVDKVFECTTCGSRFLKSFSLR